MQTPMDAPEKRELNTHERERLAELAGFTPDAFCRLTIEEIRARFGWQIDPRLLLFRRVCGRVLKRDHASSEFSPVAGAVVHVENTVSDLLHFADSIHGGGWLIMTHVRRDHLGTVTSGPDGRFGIWIPRFDIEALVRWRTTHPVVSECLGHARAQQRESRSELASEKQAVHLERVEDVPDIAFQVSVNDPSGPAAHEEFHFQAQWTVGAIPSIDLIIQNSAHDPRAFRHGIDGFSIHTGRAGNLAADPSTHGRRRAG